MKEGWEELESKEFTIPFLPPSMNAVYNILFHMRRVEMKPEVRLWKMKAKEFIPILKPHKNSYLFKLDAVIYYELFYKYGMLKKVDTQILLKVLIDAISEKNGIGDEYFKFGSYESYHDAGREKVECRLAQVTNELDTQYL